MRDPAAAFSSRYSSSPSLGSPLRVLMSRYWLSSSFCWVSDSAWVGPRNSWNPSNAMTPSRAMIMAIKATLTAAEIPRNAAPFPRRNNRRSALRPCFWYTPARTRPPGHIPVQAWQRTDRWDNRSMRCHNPLSRCDRCQHSHRNNRNTPYRPHSLRRSCWRQKAG